MQKIPVLGGHEPSCSRMNNRSSVWVFSDVEGSLFEEYCRYLEKTGFSAFEIRKNGNRRFAAFSAASEGVFLNYYENVRELTLVQEEESAYFSYSDALGTDRVTPLITQVSLEDFGMSYVVRLSDGRFLVIDGGRPFEPDADRLYACLCEQTPHEMPVIAAWIFSHPHSDHYLCFFPFMERYATRVKIEKFLFHFPDADDLEHYPKLAKKGRWFEDDSGMTNIPRLFEWIEQTGASVYAPHTGQRYRIGDADCEILACMDDTVLHSQNINATSLVIRMELGGQVILWTTDAAFSLARLPEKYGRQLKADILQVPHHGFQCGSAEAEIAGYELIRPAVCLLPAADHTAYTDFCVHRAGARHLMRADYVMEIITGTKQRSLALPYTPAPNAAEAHRRSCRQGLDNCGARTWIFSNLSTACEGDFVFQILNPTNLPSEISIDLFFEDKNRNLRYIRATVGGMTFKRLCITGNEVETDSIYYNPASLATRGIPQDAAFAVRFISNIPIVVSHETHRPSYHGTCNE
ncbi:MAG: hypothetical protein E7666_06155 [Ruminococcaceae bacterium]|nr:hypothetical protein [Oscillospiraceae bacterium]